MRTGFRAAAAGAAVLGAVAAAAPAQSATFRWAFQGDVQTMDPHGLFETMTLGFQRSIYEGLIAATRT